VAKGKIELLTLQPTNDWEIVTTKNKTKELIEQLPIEMGELLGEVKTKFRKWHFEKIGKYTNAPDVAYEHIR
jgi:hypothetical protein